jgi:hypothetical protein
MEAENHYHLHETVATSSPALRKFIEDVEQSAADNDCDIYWRGLADHRWGVRASLARLTETPTALRDADLNAAEAELLADAKRWVKATPVPPANDLEWLALLQHHWIPTQMLDFTPDPFVPASSPQRTSTTSKAGYSRSQFRRRKRLSTIPKRVPSELGR